MTDVEAAELKFRNSIAIATSSEAVWQALEELAKVCPGCTLFTVMTVDMTAGLAGRAYSNHPQQYPVAGTKPIQHNSWFDIVHGQHLSFVANTIDEIAAVFPDHELIASLGCGSVLNLPVVIKGELVATINMLAAAHHYTPGRVRAAEDLLAIPARLCWALAAMFDRDNKTTE